MDNSVTKNQHFKFSKEPTADGKGYMLVKTFLEELPGIEILVMFNNEYQLLKDLKVDGVRKLLDKVTINRKDALLLEYLEGNSLSTIIPKVGMELTECLQLCINITDCLEQIHEQGIIHKNLKPESIFIQKKEKIWIDDFSMASRSDMIIQHESDAELRFVSLPYIAPEQTGRMNRNIDFRSDLYSLGIIFYEMITGKKPFVSTDPLELIHAHLAVNPINPGKIRSDIPEVLSSIIIKLLAKNIEDRYQSAYSLKCDLEKLLSGIKSGKANPVFNIGTQLGKHRFILPQKLYGREKEISQLGNLIATLGKGPPQIAFIHGEPGVGKSALVNEVQKIIVGKRAHFINGKFDQYQKNIPYFAIQKALIEWVHFLLSENEEKLAEWKKYILDAVKDLGRLIVNLIPEIEIIIGEQDEIPELSGREAQNRFNYVMSRFMGAIARDESPIVLFIDDLQWADSASLELIRTWLEDPNNSNLFIIAAYRDNESDITPTFQIFIDGLKKTTIHSTFIKLENITLNDVEDFISDALYQGKERDPEFIQFLYQKTNGNPIFLKQLIMALISEDMISYDSVWEQWNWDIVAINQMQISDNILDLMRARISGIPIESQRLLILASCIGNNFDTSVLSVIAEMPLQDLIRHLEPALVQSLISPKGKGYRYLIASPDSYAEDIGFVFIHDRIQQSFYTLIDSDEKQKVHLNIARLLDKNYAGEERSDMIFDIAYHYDKGFDLIESLEERLHVATINHKAATKALESSAYDSALELVEFGLNNLEKKDWNENYKLLLGLNEIGAESSYLLSKEEKMEEFILTISQNVKEAYEEKKVSMLKIDHLTAQNKLDEALKAGLEILEKLGVDFPKSPKTAHIFLGLFRTQWNLRGKSPESLKDLPVMSDRDKIAALPILERIVPPAYMSGSNMFPLIVFKMVDLSVQYGNMPYSAFGYASFGITLSAVLGNYDKGYRFGQMALDLVDKFESEEYRVKVLFVTDCFLNHWKQHLKHSIEPLREAYNSGLKTGNLVGGIWSAYYTLLWGFYTSKNLKDLTIEVQEHLKIFKQLNQSAAFTRTSLLNTMILNLQSDHQVNTSLTFLGFTSEEEILNMLEETNDKTSQFFFHSCKLSLYIFNGNYTEAINHAKLARNYFDAVIGLPEVTFFTFFESIAMIFSSINDAKDYKKLIKNNLLKLKKWANSSPENYLHMYNAIQGGYLHLKGDTSKSYKYLNKAIIQANEHQYMHISAINNELAARIFLKEGNSISTKLFLENTLREYDYWGAKAVVQKLKLEFEGLQLLQTRNDSSYNISGDLDLETIIKANTVITGEIRFNSMLKKIIKVLVENVGAQRAVLIINNDNQFEVSAHGTIHNVEVEENIHLKDFSDIPHTPILFSIRTEKDLVVNDAVQHEQWGEDEFVQNNQVKSMACVVIKKQGELLGLIYLENTLARNAFTDDRLRLLRMLSTQIAVSIENSLLYTEMEQRVDRRTIELKEKNLVIEDKNQTLSATLDQLEATQDQLIHAEKMASLGVLTAGIAHEIKNPLNFVTNFSDVSLELMEEIKKEINEGNSKDALEIAEDLINNLTKIHEHGHRADSIVRSMLQHSRKGSSEKTNIELNKLVKDYINFSYKGFMSSKDAFDVILNTEFDSNIKEIDLYTEDFSRVIINLCNNAFDAMRMKLTESKNNVYQPELTIRTEINGTDQLIKISDNGVGMSEEVKEKALQPFFTTKKGTEGTGLGLSISYDIIKAHGGQLTIESTEGIGTTFTIQLPS